MECCPISGIGAAKRLVVYTKAARWTTRCWTWGDGPHRGCAYVVSQRARNRSPCVEPCQTPGDDAGRVWALMAIDA